jgi:hypothetical protein
MNTELLAICEKFIENRNVIKAAFSFESSYMYPVCASIFMNSGRKADLETLKKYHLLLKEKVSAFSNFRGISRPVIVSMIATDDAPEERLDRALEAYRSLKKHFFSGNYLPLAAIILSGEPEHVSFDDIALRTREIYDLIKKEHPFLTSEEDIVYAMLFTLAGHRAQDSIIEMERIYKILKKKFALANAVQAISHVLALGDGGSEEKCDKTLSLFNALRENNLKYGTSYELATLGVLAMLPAAESDIVSDMLDVNEFLSSQKGYSVFFGFSKQTRLMHAAMIVSAYRLGKNEIGLLGASAVSAQMMVAAQQTAIVTAQNAALCATIAANTANHS